MTTQTLEQLRAQQKAIQDQIVAVEDQARQERERQAEADRQARIVEMNRRTEYAKTGITDAIIAAIKVLRPNATVVITGASYKQVVIDNGDGLSFHLNEKYESEGGYSRSKRASGKYYIIVSVPQYSKSDRRFPPRKDGTHAYDEIAHMLVRLHEEKVATAAREHSAKLCANRSAPIATALCEEFGLTSYGTVTIKASVDKPNLVVLKVDYGMQMTADQAREMMLKLVELGVVKAKA